ncbi:MAG: hypothetical protein HDR09_09270 [Lachnospiraceae bacterium]|nr:hypothetical protein [Lachnospiraceae bacterium]
MRKRIVLIMAIACVLLITGCRASDNAEDPAGTDNQIEVTYMENAEQTDTEENIATDGVADYPAAIMVNGTVYLVEGDPMPVEVDESAIIGYTELYTGTFPENNGETNFNPELGMPYAQVEGGIAVLYKNEWYLGTPFSIDHTTTFPGIIIDHTVESLVPVICVKTLDEEVIPYEAVFFELPEGEEDWMLKIDAEVLITCSGGFTEPAPHYGTLISIKDADTDVLSPLDGVTMEVTKCSDTSVTIKITNDTDKDIECGSDFCLKMWDEETGEWRELDEVIDNAAFTSEAYMIQKDSPYEKVIDFEWLYGKLEPGRYRIVKSITDFRGTGDYTDYTYMAEFSI